MLVARNRSFLIKHSNLPPGIKRIEYIAGSTTSTAYFLIDFHPSSNTKIDIDLSLNNSLDDGYGWFFNAEDSFHESTAALNGSGFGLGWSIQFRYGYGYTGLPNFTSYTRMNLIMDKGKCYIDNILQFDWSTINVSNTPKMAIFANNRLTSGLIEIARETSLIYYMKIYENDELLFDLIPVKDNNNTVCMYNFISGQCIYNNGSGNFIAGPEIS